MKCSVCEGTGKQHVTFSNLEFDDKINKWVEKLIDESDQPCVLCDGSGEMSQEEAETADCEKRMWCKCEKKHGVKFFKDGEHRRLHKHHYRCLKCGGVVQIG